MNIFQRLKELKNYDNNILEKKRIIDEYSAKIDELNTTIHSLTEEMEQAKQATEKAINERDKEIQKTEENCKIIIEKYRSDKEKEGNEYRKIHLELNSAEQKLQMNQEKIKVYRSLLTKMFKSINDSDFEKWDNIEKMVNSLVPTVELQLHALDVPSLRSVIKDTNKLIDTILEKHEKLYTVKANRAIYQLMVIALRAELQNILTSLKYSTYDDCKKSLNTMIQKYLSIASEGNQTIAPTLKKFISEIEELFNTLLDTEYEYYVKREQEKLEQQALREQMRQEAAERKELEKQKALVEKEENKYQNEISNITDKIQNCTDESQLRILQDKIIELQKQLEAVQDKKEEIIKLQNGKAGYVYIISNLGSFGENTFKVGMTRRQEPMDRVRELGDASVPFSFDVHSFIFSDDAVGLESELHKRLHEKRKNKINMRKEFFDVSIDELEKLVREINPSAEFNRTMIATEYRQGLNIK